ncbi:MAG: carbohydrate kinase family protein [Halanaerobiales bacterium]
MIVVIGGCNIDIKGYSKKYQAHTSNPGHIIESPGGVGCNIACNLGSMGDNITLLTAVGNDHYGHLLMETINEFGVNTKYILQSGDKRSGIYSAHLDIEGDLIGAISDMKVLDEITVSYLKKHTDIMRRASVIVLDTNLNKKVIKFVVNIAGEYDIKVVVEPVSIDKSRKIMSLLKDIDYLTPNLIEAEVLLGLKAGKKMKFSKRLKRLEESYLKANLKTPILVTCGRRGICLLKGNKKRLFKAREITPDEIEETTGAGDAFTAGLAHGLEHGWELYSAIKLGLKIAEMTIKSKDTVSEDLQEELKTLNKINFKEGLE